MKNIFVTIFLLLSFCSALAGGWDIGPFDNDDALDWVWELSESEDLSVVNQALQNVIDTSGYLEAPTASMAIAAAEVVAALKGQPRAQLPAEVVEWVKTHGSEVDADLVASARQAIAHIRNEDSSELAQLWSESADAAKEWRAELTDLERRLQ